MAQTILTAQGFRRKRFDEYLAELEQEARELWGADVNLSATGPLGKFIRNQAFARAEENELAEAVYNSAYVHSAEGVNLDYAIKRSSGIDRIKAKKSFGTAAMKLTVTPGKVVTAGLIIGTAAGVDFITTTGAEDSDNDGFVIVDIEARVEGPAGNVPIGTIYIIKTPLNGITYAINTEATTQGRDKETDNQFRDRHYSSLSKSGAGTGDSIRGELLAVVGVREAFVTENDLDVVDEAGRPAHSFEAVVLGGNAVDIAAAILRKKAAGIRAFGTQTEIVKDSSGNDQTIGFSWADSAQIWTDTVITKNAAFPLNGEDLIKYEILNYIGGVDAQGQSFAGLGLGDDVIIAKIVSAILPKIPGIDDIAVTLRKGSGAYEAANVVIGSTEVAEAAPERMDVTIV